MLARGDKPDSPVLRLIQQAAKVYKHCHGEYPEVVGLDLFSLFKEWQKEPYLEHYFFVDWLGGGPFSERTFTRVCVNITPATFCAVQYDEHRMNPRPVDPSRGRDEVWCKHNEHEAIMHLLFAQRGYHAILISKDELERGREDNFHAYLLYCGYEVPRESQVFQALFDLYKGGAWGRMIETAWQPVWVWHPKVAHLLRPFAKVPIE